MKKLFFLISLFSALQSSAQISLNSGIVVAAQQSVDGKQYQLVSGKHVPYDSPAQFLSTVLSTRRHIGEIAYISVGDRIETWQFIGGIANGNFVRVNYPSYLKYPLKALNDSTATLYSDSIQAYTTGSAITVNNYVDVLVINPATVQSTLTITLPDTASYRNGMQIFFGGTIGFGSNVITSITVSPGSGQTILMPPESSPITSGTIWNLKLVANKWYLQ